MKIKIDINKPETFSAIIASALHSHHKHLVNPNFRGSESTKTIIDDVTSSVWIKLTQLKQRGGKITSLSGLIYIMANRAMSELYMSLNGRSVNGKSPFKSKIADDLPINFESINPTLCNGLVTVELSRVLDKVFKQPNGDLFIETIVNEGSISEQLTNKGVGKCAGYCRLDEVRGKIRSLRRDGVI